LFIPVCALAQYESQLALSTRFACFINASCALEPRRHGTATEPKLATKLRRIVQ